MKKFRDITHHHWRIGFPSIVLWLNLATIVAIGQSAEGGRWYTEATDSSYSTTQPMVQSGKDQAKLSASAIPKRSSQKKWILTMVICMVTSFLLVLSLVCRTIKQQALQLKLRSQQLRQSEQQMKRLKRLNRIVAHDILSNLNLIISAGNTWAGTHPKKENLVRYHEMTHRSVHRLKAYCLSILEEVRNTNMDGVQSATDPMPILKRVLENFESALHEAGFEVQIAPLSPVLLPAPIQEQVFRNVVANAILHAASARQPLLRIAEEQDESGYVYWVLEDNGPGIPAEQRESIFNADTPQKESFGQQIGLSLLRDILRDYGADIRVEERKGGGARFVVELPG